MLVSPLACARCRDARSVKLCARVHRYHVTTIDIMPGVQITTSLPAAVLAGTAPTASDALKLDAPGMPTLHIPLLPSEQSELM